MNAQVSECRDTCRKVGDQSLAVCRDMMVYLVRVYLSDSPVRHKRGWMLHPWLCQNSLVLALLVQPVEAVKDIPDVGGQVQHVNMSAVMHQLSCCTCNVGCTNQTW